jgi:hypothetical protein
MSDKRIMFSTGMMGHSSRIPIDSSIHLEPRCYLNKRRNHTHNCLV